MWLAPTRTLNVGPAGFFNKGLDLFDVCERAVHAVGQPQLLLKLNDTETRRYYACMARLSAAHVQADKLLGGHYALHLHAYLREGFSGSQFLLIPTSTLNDASVLLNSVAPFLGLPSVGAPPRGCTSSTSTNKGQAVGNQSLAQVTDEFLHSATAARARAYFGPHNTALARLLHTRGVKVAGAVPTWVS